MSNLTDTQKFEQKLYCEDGAYCLLKNSGDEFKDKINDYLNDLVNIGIVIKFVWLNIKHPTLAILFNDEIINIINPPSNQNGWVAAGFDGYIICQDGTKIPKTLNSDDDLMIHFPRIDIPSYVKYHRDIANAKKMFDKEICYKNTNGYKAYWLDGKRHCTSGPAIEFPNGDKQYWLYGKQYTKEEFDMIIEKDNLENKIGISKFPKKEQKI